MQKIMIVDNSTDLLTLFTYIFKNEKVEVTCCLDKDEMFVSLQSGTPDLMIIDVMGTGVDERTIINDIRKRNALEAIPIIITSTKRSHVSNYQAFKANDGIEKPFDIHDVTQKVRSLLAMA